VFVLLVGAVAPYEPDLKKIYLDVLSMNYAWDLSSTLRMVHLISCYPRCPNVYLSAKTNQPIQSMIHPVQVYIWIN
jgi:hypothetical protein